MIPPGFLCPRGFEWRYNADQRHWEFGKWDLVPIRQWIRVTWLTEEFLVHGALPNLILKEIIGPLTGDT